MQDGSVYNTFRCFLLFTGRDGVLCYLQDHPAYNHFGYTQDGPANNASTLSGSMTSHRDPQCGAAVSAWSMFGRGVGNIVGSFFLPAKGSWQKDY